MSSQSVKRSESSIIRPNLDGKTGLMTHLIFLSILLIDLVFTGVIVWGDIGELKRLTDKATRLIPVWIKVAVAIALGLGTMVGWKRIVVTVGEKVGKSHLAFGQGASAEMVAMLTIGAADLFGLPVSTTHVLSSGVASSMSANRSGLQIQTIRNLAMAWIATLPAAMCLSGLLFWTFSQIF